ncbi:MAG: TRAP transporter large permease [Roseitalea sp.]|uniref:TRAP transporter large permease protein n=1 Tax=Oceaniradius stylonematis TaxID=2184161 RepID=A0A3A8A913_9HYPH|nr:TRAP transporter large permease [Oceaniradius stylonematis]MBO6552724.1 TRAP transporter large permease [Roseitalea sp.]MBO6950355.1 TRAP transporter large permease [Rhizobiaceae bacterium]RNC94788.1 MAG: TRAP transporter large permease [Oricola sp.]MBO6591656.1 TRAP transporter large permease [Roseitalea sp.]MBO6599511.1 TRAP transporter large permease [Roseitalea sp.]
MTNFEIGLLSFPALLLLIFLRVPIGLAMFTTGFVGLWLTNGSAFMAMARLKTETFTTFSSYSLSIVPMFLLMGCFATLGGMSQALFKAAEAWIGHRKGGIAMAAIGACAGFGAICGSSLATAATMGRVALPELRQYGYAGGFSTATLAAGGTLGILIPPSIVLVIYAILTEQNIAKLFLAAVIPGLLAAAGYVLVISIYVRLNPEAAGVRERVGYGERFRALFNVWPVLLVFMAVVGGIYAGIFTPTEGAAVGALGTGLIAWWNGGLTRQSLVSSFLSTGRSTAMIFFIVLGAGFYNGFLALTQVPQELSNFVVEQGFSPWLVLAIILVLYLIFGCVMDSLSMILLTIPIFFPVISSLDFGMTPEQVAIWFGILVLIVVEVGLITPPVGMNLFIINAMDRGTPITATYRAVMWFVASDIVRVIVLAAFPAITLFLIS